LQFFCTALNNNVDFYDQQNVEYFSRRWARLCKHYANR